ncbi:sulfotransferase [uncultured Thiohalocapsa sp.]|uniref:sulfotransferase n=1 Tax=uncultured Thiohalocapsa sp. TaxID=768990 RepID=UPI0025D84601|nr:sulfotransferase [uncultured Thiohalocapsa sp.]
MNALLRSVALAAQRRFAGFDPWICEALHVDIPSQLQPVFLVGAPRTGSTLLFQLLAQHYRLTYISNLMALAPRYMVRLSLRWPGLCSGYRGGLRESRFGYLPGLLSPNEAGRLMRDWFDGDNYPTTADMVRATVAALAGIADGPLVLKNQTNTLRLDNIRHVFSDARMLHLRRDMRFTAQSLILARRRLLGSAEHWWSVAPPGYESVLDREPLYQVLWQVEQLEELGLLACLAKPDASLVVDYDRLCIEPARTLERIAAKFELAARDTSPPALQPAEVAKLPAAEWDRLIDIHREHFAASEQRRIERARVLDR